MAVISVATGVIPAELVAMNEDRDEALGAFTAPFPGKAETCSYQIGCSCCEEGDFT